MNDDFNDTQLDAALDAVARPEPPRGHEAEVLARTWGRPDAGRADAGRAGSPSRPPLVLRPRWVLPIAATVLAVFGAIWQGDRQLRAQLDRSMASETDRSASGPYPRVDPQLDLPVLPPQAYWGMDAFAEFETLRPGGRDASPRRPSARARVTSADDAGTWTGDVAETAGSENRPYPPMLPTLELVSIVPAPIVIAPLMPLDDIVLTAIPIEPIVIAPLIEEENP